MWLCDFGQLCSCANSASSSLSCAQHSRVLFAMQLMRSAVLHKSKESNALVRPQILVTGLQRISVSDSCTGICGQRVAICDRDPSVDRSRLARYAWRSPASDKQSDSVGWERKRSHILVSTLLSGQHANLHFFVLPTITCPHHPPPHDSTPTRDRPPLTEMDTDWRIPAGALRRSAKTRCDGMGWRRMDGQGQRRMVCARRSHPAEMASFTSPHPSTTPPHLLYPIGRHPHSFITSIPSTTSPASQMPTPPSLPRGPAACQIGLCACVPLLTGSPPFPIIPSPHHTRNGQHARSASSEALECCCPPLTITPSQGLSGWLGVLWFG